MENLTKTLILLTVLGLLSACAAQQSYQDDKSRAVLVFTKTEGFRHNSIPDGIALFKKFAENDARLKIIATDDSTQFSSSNLGKFSAVVFLNTTGDVLAKPQQNALKKFIQQGGGFMGVHSATDTEYGWPWYGEMIGARFSSHPAIQKAALHVLTKEHPATRYLPKKWIRTDEWYNFRDIQKYIEPLMTLDESTYEGGENGVYHPVAWSHEFEGGRIFYTAGGHTAESYKDSLFSQHLRGGLKFVLKRAE